VPGISTTLPAGNASNLFPQISPTAVPSPASGTQTDLGKQGAQPVADSSTIPLALGSPEFGAQIFGLIMLLLGAAIAVTRRIPLRAIAVTRIPLRKIAVTRIPLRKIAVTRISLRKMRITGKGGTGN
jgi:hypothetical protein